MDYESLGNNNLVTTTDTDGVPILPYEWQVCRWGYTESTLGGIKLKNLKLDEQIYDNTILQKHLSDMIERYQGIEQGESYEVESGSDYVIFGSTLYTYPEMDGNIVISYTDKYELSGYKIYNNIIYPNYVILNDTVGITINYKEDAGNMVGSVEKNTIVGHSEWVQVGEEQLRPFIHYFYMPLGAKEDIYYVTLTAYKDSEKDFKHSISIKLPFTNKESIFDEIVTVIKDN